MVGWSVGALGAVAVLAFLGLALLFALTFPYHEWDAFGYGEWSRRIATTHAFDPAPQGPDAASRPVFFVLQGLLWWLTGVSFVAGRLLSLVFAVIAVVGTAMIVERGRGRVLAMVAFLSITVFSIEAISGKTDVPAAAAVAAVAAVALADPSPRRRGLPGGLALLAVLTKASSVIPALVGVGLALLLVEKPWSRARLARSRSLELGIGMAAGLAYEWWMAMRFHLSLFEFLRTGTTGYYAQLAHSARRDTLLRLDFLGADLRLPLAFALVFAVTRALSVSHRYAASLGLAVGGGYALIGPYVAGDSNGPFADPYSSFAFVGFALLLAFAPFAPLELQPSRLRTTQLLLIAVPPTIVWIRFGIYENRLEAPAWPALAALIGVCLFCAVRSAHRVLGVGSLAAVPVLAIALWASFVSFDGFHGPMWAEFRSLGWHGIWNDERTTNIVLPAIQESVAALKPLIGTDGRLVASDPHFLFWFPRTTLTYPTRCSMLEQADGFVLSTGDESRMVMRGHGGSPDPATWAACRRPRLRELTDGSNGLATFVVLR